MVACACTFKPVLDDLILFWHRVRGQEHEVVLADDIPHPETIGRARERKPEVDCETILSFREANSSGSDS